MTADTEASKFWKGSKELGVALVMRTGTVLTRVRRVPRPFVPSLESRVRGRTVLITGASSGIGRQLAIRVAEAGAIVLVTARRADLLDDLIRLIRGAGDCAASIPGDLASDDGINSVADAVLAKYGAPDVLVLNAGRSIMRTVAESEFRLHDFERTVRVNYLGAVGLLLRFLPGMSARRSGQVVHTSSITVPIHGARFSAYVASKSALESVLNVAAVEHLNDGVKFTNVRLPLVETEMIAGADWTGFARLTTEEAVEMMVDAIRRQPRQLDHPVSAVGRLLYGVAPRMADRVQSYFHTRMENLIQ
ncbi:SDR family NAD(P)-dependent oxidoreductase [Mycolicibacterium litorale]|uniref:SDR family NAD(P)-dependent oxidoreductase n=1 Tax=Mycolicibacterium litorale TaxID=758802 RepID=UPI0039A13EBD